MPGWRSRPGQDLSQGRSAGGDADALTVLPIVRNSLPMNHREQFVSQGYLILPGALPAGPCEAFGAGVLAEYDRQIEAGWSFSGGGSLAGHLNIRMGERGRELLALAQDAGISDLVAQLAGGPVALRQAVGNLNLPGSCMQDFHMDGLFADRMFIANVCLTATDRTILRSPRDRPISGSRIAETADWRVDSVNMNLTWKLFWH